MSNDDLNALAQEAGVSVHWRDAFGYDRVVDPDCLRAVLQKLDLPAGSSEQIAESRRFLADQHHGLPPLVTAVQDQSIVLKMPPGRWRLALENGDVLDGIAGNANGNASLPGVAQIGYHRLEIGDAETILAVAPSRCFGMRDLADHGLWGLAVQLYSLRRDHDGGVGDFTALAEFMRDAAGQGASCVAISPVHAQFSADINRFSPYSPSSRLLLNVLHADPGIPCSSEERALEQAEFIDWPGMARAKLRRFRQSFEQARQNPHIMAAFAAFRQERGDVLERHARFEALHDHFFTADPTKWNWRGWDEPFRDPSHPAVTAFAAEKKQDVDFHAFMQFLADQGLQNAHRAARDAGMKVGLIADLAVGTDGGGSHCWSRQDETLIGLSVGAPPDLLSLHGQNWGLTAFSPTGLRRHGYGAFIEMLRAAMRHAGGVRIDHAMGLERLWVVPEGASADHGAYLKFPFQDLMRLLALESHRARAVVVAEDLGTVPDGFQQHLQDADILGMRVLYFERDGAQNFIPPDHWTPKATAMTSTHDLATVAGWWKGRDLECRAKIGLLGDTANIDRNHQERWRDRHMLWNSFRQSGAATGETPMPHDCWPVVDAAIRHVGNSACDLVILPVEDLLALDEQPNLPGTLDEHPNWRRRLPSKAGEMLAQPEVRQRLEGLNESRRAKKRIDPDPSKD